MSSLKTRKAILVQPVGGLCNRLRVLVSALIQAELMGRPCHLLWWPRMSCNCRFDDLFEPTPVLRVVPYWYIRVTKYFGLSPFANSINVSNGQIITQDSLAAMNYMVDTHALEKYSVLYFKDCYSDFMPYDMSPNVYSQKVTQYLQLLLPKRSIAKRLLSLPSTAIGVHIRRGDNRVSSEMSRVDDFITEMKRCVKQQPDIVFFVATDDPAVEVELKRVFAAKIITFPKSSYARSNKIAIQEALIDLLLLSRCKRILGSYYSSFSDYASLFNRAELYKVGYGRWEGPAYDIRQRSSS